VKLAFRSLFLLLFGTTLAHAQISTFQHVVIIFQENRTPDNLFQGVCVPPFGTSASCSTTPNASQYNIQTSNWLNKHSPTGVIQPLPVPLGNTYDLAHSHRAFTKQCDVNAAGACKMDGSADVGCSGTCLTQPQFRFVDNSTGILNPYLKLATQYGFANFMFQTNQGPSFPAHQFIFGGTSAPSANNDRMGIFAAENMKITNTNAGCIADATNLVELIRPNPNPPPPGIENSAIYPCFEHQTIPDILPLRFSWRYYAPGVTPISPIWTAPNAISHICQSTGPGGACQGPEWLNNVDLTPAHVLSDISSCHLRSMSWVIPIGQNSDHAGNANGIGGPSWVASIVNAIGTNPACPNREIYWNNTAILITWDDWGGWYDHEQPTILPLPQGDYQYGFRVPLLVVSAYTPAAYVDNVRHDFGSILRFIEHNFGTREGQLTFADQRATTDLRPFFHLNQTPRPFVFVPAPLNAAFFLNDKRMPIDPDDY